LRIAKHARVVGFKYGHKWVEGKKTDKLRKNGMGKKGGKERVNNQDQVRPSSYKNLLPEQQKKVWTKSATTAAARKKATQRGEGGRVQGGRKPGKRQRWFNTVSRSK